MTTTDPASPRPRPRGSRVSRRQVLAASVATAGLAAVGQGVRTFADVSAQDATSATPMASPVAGTPVPFASGQPLQEPRVLRSENGRLDLAFTAQYGPATIGGQPVTTFSYNGEVPPPTLRLAPLSKS